MICTHTVRNDRSTTIFQLTGDFRNESDALHTLLAPLDDHFFNNPTLFKGWTANDILGHLHIWNRAADMSLHNNDEFQHFIAQVMIAVQQGQLRSFERQWLGDIQGQQLLALWHGYYQDMSERFAKADPRARMQWAGPDMSVRSSITARLMETWAHGQALYDLLGVTRIDHDRVKNIVVLGINTFGWTFKNRGLPTPDEKPYVELSSPSGNETWQFNEKNSRNSVAGSATEFCQVVTQVRHFADTELCVTGEVAQHWMEIAQCFAGPAVDPPLSGTRYKAEVLDT